MRRKSSRGKARPTQTPTRRSLRSSSRTSRALPVLLSQDDGCHEQSVRIRRIVLEMSSDNDDNGGEVPHSVEKEVNLSAQMGNNNSEDSMEKRTCIRCKGRERDDHVLICSEIGCLISVHEKCMGCNPWFDDSGKFYCPFCKQKQFLARLQESRRKVKDAKKALLNFLEGIKVDDNKGNEKRNRREKTNEPCKLPSAADGICHGDENNVNNVEVENQADVEEDVQKRMENAELGSADQDMIVLENEVNQPDTSVVNSGDNVGCRAEVQGKAVLFEMGGHKTLVDGEEEGLGPKGDSEDEIIGKDKEETETFCTSHDGKERIEDEQQKDSDLEPMDVSDYDNKAAEELYASRIAEKTNSDGAVKISNKRANIWVSKNNEGVEEEDEEQMQPQTSDRLANANAISEKESLAKPHGRFKQRAGKAAHVQDVSPSMRTSPRLKKTFLRRKASANKNVAGFYQKSTNSKKSRGSAKQHTTVIFPEGKRRRLHWTAEEEDMLKEGVKKYSLITNVNIPWRKILEYGHHVFHETRCPMDLKDKWRNMDKGSTS